MAPFKLKFRMGSSRSTSQETEVEPPAQPLLGSSTGTIGSSTVTINSDFNSLGSINSSDQRNLIPCNSSDERTGYTNPTLSQNFIEITNSIPHSPPPSYEHVLEENRIANLDKDNNPTVTITTSSLISTLTSSGSVPFLNNPIQSANSPMTELNLNENPHICHHHHQHQGVDCESVGDGTTGESNAFVYSTMTTPSQEDLLGNIGGGSCDPLFSAQSEEQIDLDDDAVDIEHDRCSSRSENLENNNSDEDWDSHEHQSQELQPPDIDTFINNKSTKEIYKAVAKQMGITCKMSEQCRCIECQSNYFDCEFDENDHQKTDGGLGATTPMFISEVMHGSACNIL